MGLPSSAALSSCCSINEGGISFWPKFLFVMEEQLKHSVRNLVIALILTCLGAIEANSQTQMASLRPDQQLLWHRISPSPEQPGGPVLYQILFRSSAKPGFVPKIDGNFTLTNSLITEDNAGVHIGALAIAPTGAITLCCGQSFGAGGAGGTVTNIATGTGLTGGPISTSGTISIANGGVTTVQIGSGAATSGQVLTADGFGGAAWQNLPFGSQSWSLLGNAGTGCTTSPCTNFLGTTDNSALEIRVMGNRAFRIEPATDGQAAFGFSPNVIGGYSGNAVIGPGTAGATIAGGGAKGIGNENLINTVSGSFGTVGGGYFNTASGTGSTVAGGGANVASGENSFSTVGGGSGNISNGNYSVVAGGASSSASGDYSTVSGGARNSAVGNYATVIGGYFNGAAGNYSTVAGGAFNSAGNYSFAAGQHANTNGHTGSFVWGDNSTTNDVTATADNQFVARTSGGVIFYTKSDLSTGVSVAAGGGSWSSLSDRNVKANFAPIDGRQILAQVLAMPVTTWNYKSQAASIRHIGPMAQDFHAAFQVGEDDKHITEIDEGGVVFAAIQGLNQKLENNVEQLHAQLKNKDAQISAQQKQIEVLEQQVRAMMTRVEAVEKTSRKNARGRMKLTPFGIVDGL